MTLFKLSYTASLVQTDGSGNPNGDVFEVSGVQFINSTTPQSSDITTAATNAGTDIGNKMAAAYPVQNAQDSGQDSSGGSG